MAQPARQYSQQLTHFLRKTITYSDNGTTVTIGTIPSGAIIVKPASGVHITTAFNGATTNTLDVGPSTDTGTDLWATALSLTALNFIPLDELVGSLLVTSDTIVQCAVTATATATAGSAEVIIQFIPDTDG